MKFNFHSQAVEAFYTALNSVDYGMSQLTPKNIDEAKSKLQTLLDQAIAKVRLPK